MIHLLKNKKINKNKIHFNSIIGNIKIFFIDKSIKFPNNVNILLKNETIYFKGPFGILNTINKEQNLNIYKKKNNIIFILTLKKKKKSILNLYYKLYLIKIKGVLKNFKLHLLLKGIGFKAILQKDILQLKVGFSHNININIPKNIQISNQINSLIFSSNNFILLTQFIHLIKKIKKPDKYKGKGLLLKNEFILLKEGKKSKK